MQDLEALRAAALQSLRGGSYDASPADLEEGEIITHTLGGNAWQHAKSQGRLYYTITSINTDFT
jgi:hypothetical protein